ncbi:MAG TPA: hypothetical protein VES69_03910 [Pyrinomonadaceae bacterium]|nr:hypothetical protein [Pyrinomonadaceae bacterium]
MKLMRWVPAIAFTVILVVAAWVWWNRPQSNDMANYAPADALVYLECNSLLDVVDAIASTDAWKELSPLLGTSGNQPPNRWLTRVISWTGIGPTRTVILARAQLATVMLDLGAKEQGETLTIKPEAAILIETHTAERRIRPTVEEALRLFAEKSYRQPTLKKTDVVGSEFLVWSAPTSARQIVATIDGTLVIIGNSERAVKTCLEVRRGHRPSLKSHPEMQRMRRHLAAADTLAFGFISSSNAARLFSLVAPLLFGRAPGDARFDQIIGTSASKVLAGVGWSSRVSSGGIEDHYLFSLQSTLVSRLQQHFRPANTPIQVFDMLPNDVHSVSVYRFENPVATWQLLETTLSSQLDTLSAMVVTSLLKSALTPYGIEDPERFLNLVGPELNTVRLTRETEQSTLVAQVRDEASLRQLLLGPGGRNPKHSSIGEAELIQIPGKMIAVSFLKARVLIGPPADLQLHLQAATDNRATPDQVKKLEYFLGRSNSASVVTYTRESDRVRKFVEAISRASGGTTTARESTELSRKIEQLPYSATETTLGDQGLERITRSSFGQFATLVPLVFPEQ